MYCISDQFQHTVHWATDMDISRGIKLCDAIQHGNISIRTNSYRINVVTIELKAFMTYFG